MTFIGAIPNILRWSIQISIFIALFVPLFDEIAASLGSDYRFRDLFRQAMHLDLSRVLTTLRSILFGLHS
jgi:putative exporter of polyketide antibiotics